MLNARVVYVSITFGNSVVHVIVGVANIICGGLTGSHADLVVAEEPNIFAVLLKVHGAVAAFHLHHQ